MERGATRAALRPLTRLPAPPHLHPRFFTAPSVNEATTSRTLHASIQGVQSVRDLAALCDSPSARAFSVKHYLKVLERAAAFGGADGAALFERLLEPFSARAVGRSAVEDPDGAFFAEVLNLGAGLRLRAAQAAPLLSAAGSVAPLFSARSAAYALRAVSLLAAEGGADPAAVRHFAVAVARTADAFHGPAAAHALSAAAKLQLDAAGGGELVAPLVAAAARTVGSMTPQNLASSLWALGKIDAALARGAGGAAEEGAWRAAPLLAAAAATARASGSGGAGGFNAHEVSQCLMAAALLGVRAPPTVTPLADAAARLAPSFKPIDASSCLWAVGSLGLQGAPCVDALAAAAAAHAHAFNELGVKNVSAAVTMLRLSDAALLEALGAARARHSLSPYRSPARSPMQAIAASAATATSATAASAAEKTFTAELARAATQGGIAALRATVGGAPEGTLSLLHELVVCMECVKLRANESSEAQVLFEAHARRWLARCAATGAREPRSFHSAAELLRACAAFHIPYGSPLVNGLCRLAAVEAPAAAISWGAGAFATALAAAARLGARDGGTVEPLAAAAARAADAADLLPHNAADGLWGAAVVGSRSVAVVGPLAAAAVAHAPHMGPQSALVSVEAAALLGLGDRFAAPLVEALARCAPKMSAGAASRALRALQNVDVAEGARGAARAALNARMRAAGGK
jgi:hypothetical protein